MSTCPCCGSTMTEAGFSALEAISLPPMERRVLDTLLAAFPKELTAVQIADRVWSDDPNGGPQTAHNGVSVYMNRLRHKIRAYGWTAGAGQGHKGIRLRQLQNGTH